MYPEAGGETHFGECTRGCAPGGRSPLATFIAASGPFDFDRCAQRLGYFWLRFFIRFLREAVCGRDIVVGSLW